MCVYIHEIIVLFAPAVCLGLIWDSDQPPVDDIMAVVNNIGLTLQLSDVRNKFAAYIHIHIL